jgi:hypothetical protein
MLRMVVEVLQTFFNVTAIIWYNYFVHYIVALYSRSCDIQHIQDRRVAGCYNFPGIRKLYLMYILVYLETLWTDPTI